MQGTIKGTPQNIVAAVREKILPAIIAIANQTGRSPQEIRGRMCWHLTQKVTPVAFNESFGDKEIARVLASVVSGFESRCGSDVKAIVGAIAGVLREGDAFNSAKPLPPETIMKPLAAVERRTLGEMGFGSTPDWKDRDYQGAPAARTGSQMLLYHEGN